MNQRQQAGFLGGLLLASNALELTNAQSSSCITSINTLATLESGTNVDLARVYTLCANSEYQVGNLNFDNELVDGQEMIPLRPNLHIKCGQNGNRFDNCVLKGGDVQMDGTHYLGIHHDTVENVTIEGVTFEGANRHMVWLSRPGNVVFRDCEFRGSRVAQTPILLDYFSKDVGEELSVTFENCLFVDNKYGGKPAQPALIVGNSHQNRLVFRENLFAFNNFIVNNTEYEKVSSIIETSGPLTMLKNCFDENKVGVAPVMIYSTENLFVDNFQYNSNGGICGLASRYEDYVQYNSGAPRCSTFDATECFSAVSTTRPPTNAPTTSPAPSDSPTSSPSSEPSAAPSVYPSEAPSPSPSDLPTSELRPSTSPTITLAPSSAPSTTSMPTSLSSSSPALVWRQTIAIVTAATASVIWVLAV